MRRLLNVKFWVLIFFMLFLFASCENPFFISATRLYKVTFSVNGGSPVEEIRTDCIKINPYTSKSDCTFMGWYLTSDFSGGAVNFPLELTGDTSLYAKWQTMYTVSFETNGGSSLESYKTGLIENAPDVSRADFVLAGWYTTADFSGTAISFPYTVTKPVTLYAKWIPTYNVSFETNGGSVISSCRVTEISSAPETIRDGYTFAGWYTDSELNVHVEFPFTPTHDTVLYAKWQKNYTISFVTNGGSSVENMSCGYIEREPVTTKKDSSFAGWYADSEFIEENKIQFPYTVTDDITLYAKWKSVQCTVTYYANGATAGSVPVSVSVDKGSSYKVSGNTGDLVKTGYAFTKWNTRADGSGQGYSAGSSITVTSDVTLYAQWGKDYGAMVTVNGGSFYFGDPNTTSARPKITLSSFQIAQYEVTYELWLEVAAWAKENGYNLSSANKGYAANDKFKSFVPATNITWNMACVWLNAYSAYKGLEPVYYRGNAIWKDDTSTNGTFSWNKSKNGFRLPTECEWEFAAGGGNAETHDTYTYSGSNTVGEVAWYSSNSGEETHPVGTKKTNALGIYDMSGNVAEWCYDFYADFGTGELTNPVHESGNYRCIRGGGFYHDSSYKPKIISRAYSGSSDMGSNWSERFSPSEMGIRPVRNVE